jgi:addiction module antidote protein HigA
MRLSRYFGTTPGFWMNLQMCYELDRAEDALGDTLSGIVPLAMVEVA